MEYTDSDFIAAVEDCTVESFRHSGHVRLALLYAARYGLPEAEERMAAGLRRLAVHAGQPEKYHHTMTIAWMRLAARMLDRSALSAYYSHERLNSAAAREGWVEPDLSPLP